MRWLSSMQIHTDTEIVLSLSLLSETDIIYLQVGKIDRRSWHEGLFVNSFRNSNLVNSLSQLWLRIFVYFGMISLLKNADELEAKRLCQSGLITLLKDDVKLPGSVCCTGCSSVNFLKHKSGKIMLRGDKSLFFETICGEHRAKLPFSERNMMTTWYGTYLYNVPLLWGKSTYHIFP